MTFYSTDVFKPSTQICNQQPRNIFDLNIIGKSVNDSHVILNNVNINAKPVAYVSPIEKSNIKDQAVQTDSISIDINSIINIQDFHRSERMVSKLDMNTLNETTDSYDLESARKKIKSLENELKLLLKSNDDIKKLLIASLGEDLAAHLVKLTSDVASFNELVTQLNSQQVDCKENIDKLSIEADLWKNKFVAGRVLVDELAGWKHYFSLRYKESISAIHSLLNERQSLRQLLTMISNELLLMSAHMDHKPQAMELENTLHLAKYDLILLKEIRNRLSVGARWRKQVSTHELYFVDFKDFTDGEKLALEVLQNQPNPYADNTARITTSFVSEKTQCLEKIADKLCKNCRGEIFVV